MENYQEALISTNQCLVNSNQVAHQLLINGRGTMSSKVKLHTDATREVMLVYPFSEEEYRKGILAPNNGKAASINDVGLLVKQLNNIGPTVQKWLLDMLNKCFT